MAAEPTSSPETRRERAELQQEEAIIPNPPIPIPFVPANWYWVVGGSTTQVYSSSAGDYVPISDAAYQAWLASGNMPTQIDTNANLGQVLSQYQLRPVNASVLDGYIGALADDVVATVIFKVLFNHENRIRALEGQGAITVAQARNAIKALM